MGYLRKIKGVKSTKSVTVPLNAGHQKPPHNQVQLSTNTNRSLIPSRPMAATPKESPSNFCGVESTFRPLPKGSPTRKHLYKSPESWVSQGGATQLVGRSDRRSMDVVIGLDFGTSYTKAAVGFLDKIFPVTWEGVSNCEPVYLLPSEYTVIDANIFVIV